MDFPVKSKLKTITQWSVLLFFAVVINFNFCLGQNLGGSLKIDLGYSAIHIKDTRHSSIFRTGHGGHLVLQYSLQEKQSSNELGLKLAYTIAFRNNNLISSVFASEMNIFYEHLRKLENKHWELGAYVDHGAFSTDRDGGYWYGFEDNPSFSYVIWSSFGLSTKYHSSLGKHWGFNFKASLPLVAFSERPTYSFIYPEDHYDLDDYFLLFQSAYFERAKFQTLFQFTNLQIQTGFQHRLGERGNQIGLNYQFNYLFAGGIKPLFSFNNHFSITYQLYFRKS